MINIAGIAGTFTFQVQKIAGFQHKGAGEACFVKRRHKAFPIYGPFLRKEMLVSGSMVIMDMEGKDFIIK